MNKKYYDTLFLLAAFNSLDKESNSNIVDRFSSEEKLKLVKLIVEFMSGELKNPTNNDDYLNYIEARLRSDLLSQ